MIASPTIPQQVKQLCKTFLAIIAAKKPCIDRADLDCILETFKTEVEPDMRRGISLTQGALKQLFQKLLAFDEKLVSELSGLPKSAGKKGVKIADKILDEKATEVNKYLGQM